MNRYIMVFTAFFIFVVAQNCAAAKAAQRCGNFDEINIGSGRILANSFYDASGVVGGQCIISAPISWRWTLQADGSVVKSYPSIIYGRKPWRAASTVAGMPTQIQKTRNLKVILAASAGPASGRYNTSFDIWIVSAPPGTLGQVVAEVMIFLNSTDWVDVGPQIGTKTIDGVDYRLVASRSQNWPLYQFKSVAPRLNGTYDILKFVNSLVADGKISAENYISDVEFGNEIKMGSGSTTVSTFIIQR